MICLASGAHLLGNTALGNWQRPLLFQVCKESCAAGSIALDTLRLAKNSLCELISDLNINTAEDASIELMETLVKLSKDSDPIISPSMLKAVMEYDSSEVRDENDLCAWAPHLCCPLALLQTFWSQRILELFMTTHSLDSLCFFA